MARSMGIRSRISRKGEKFAYAVPLEEGRKRGVAYCTSDEALARAYASRGGRWGGSGKGSVGRGATCELAKKAALQALRGGRTVTARKPAKKSVAACVAACKRR